MRRAAIGAALALVGCQTRPDVEACQRFAAAAYGAAVRTQTATIDDTPMSPDGLVAQTGIDLTAPLNRVQAGIWRDLAEQGRGLTLRLVRPDYETTGPVCAFVLEDGKLGDRDTLLLHADRHAADVKLRASALAIGGATGRALLETRKFKGRPAHFDCCVGP